MSGDASPSRTNKVARGLNLTLLRSGVGREIMELENWTEDLLPGHVNYILYLQKISFCCPLDICPPKFRQARSRRCSPLV